MVSLVLFVDLYILLYCFAFFFQAEASIRDLTVTGVQTCALPIFSPADQAALVLQAPRIATTWGINFAFGGAWPDFQARLGAAWRAVDVLSIVAVVACLACGAAGVALALASSDDRRRRLGRAAAVAWGGNVLLLFALGVDLHPHYNFASAWVPVFGVAALIAGLRRRSPGRGALALAA